MSRLVALFTGRQAAAHAGITYNAWKLAPKTRAGRPPPDDVETFGGRRIELWSSETINAWRALRPPTHAEIIANRQSGRPQRVARATVRRHLRRHETRACSCYTTPKGLRI